MMMIHMVQFKHLTTLSFIHRRTTQIQIPRTSVVAETKERRGEEGKTEAKGRGGAEVKLRAEERAFVFHLPRKQQ